MRDSISVGGESEEREREKKKKLIMCAVSLNDVNIQTTPSAVDGNLSSFALWDEIRKLPMCAKFKAENYANAWTSREEEENFSLKLNFTQ